MVNHSMPSPVLRLEQLRVVASTAAFARRTWKKCNSGRPQDHFFLHSRSPGAEMPIESSSIMHHAWICMNRGIHSAIQIIQSCKSWVEDFFYRIVSDDEETQDSIAGFACMCKVCRLQIGLSWWFCRLPGCLPWSLAIGHWIVRWCGLAGVMNFSCAHQLHSCSNVVLQAGDALLINNSRCNHGRTAFNPQLDSGYVLKCNLSMAT